jgi:hypothetical protein
VKIKLRNVIFPAPYDRAHPKVHEDVVIDKNTYSVSVAIEGPTKVMTIVDRAMYTMPERYRVCWV